MDSPKTGSGLLHFMLMGAGAALFALVIAQYFPSLIPARATTVRL
jgi:hypothetical protein